MDGANAGALPSEHWAEIPEEGGSTHCMPRVQAFGHWLSLASVHSTRWKLLRSNSMEGSNRSASRSCSLSCAAFRNTRMLRKHRNCTQTNQIIVIVQTHYPLLTASINNLATTYNTLVPLAENHLSKTMALTKIPRSLKDQQYENRLKELRLPALKKAEKGVT